MLRAIAHLSSLALVAAALTVVVGCKSEPAANSETALGALNTTCACGGAADHEHTVNFGGKDYAFCGQACIEHFNEMSDTDKAAMIAKVK